MPCAFKLRFFLKINGSPKSICSYSSNISCQWLCWGDSPGGRVLKVSKCPLTEKADGSSSRGEYAGMGVFVWKWRDKQRAGVIQFFNKSLFCILHEGDWVTLGGMELQIKFYLMDTVTEAHPSALVWKQSCYLAMLLSKTMLIWYNYCDFKNY